MAKKTEVLAAVVIALAQSLAGCSVDEGVGVVPPAQAAQPAERKRVAPPMDQAQPARRDGVAVPGSKPPFLPRQDIPIPRPSIVDREGWSASRFFTTPNELQICQVISSGDKERLKALLDTGVELNKPGSNFGPRLAVRR